MNQLEVFRRMSRIEMSGTEFVVWLHEWTQEIKDIDKFATHFTHDSNTTTLEFSVWVSSHWEHLTRIVDLFWAYVAAYSIWFDFSVPLELIDNYLKNVL